ncbi:MAG TPA: hypothetical protein VK172_06065 [Lentimicrobium sp.]|nr:hypothetical protein [Lentimicrobium sp.]
MNKIIFCSLLFLINYSINAQTDLRPGYIIDKGETTYGKSIIGAIS